MGMTASPTVAQRLLEAGVPPSLLIDLLDPQGMKAALASEVLEHDVAQAAVHAALERVLRTA